MYNIGYDKKLLFDKSAFAKKPFKSLVFTIRANPPPTPINSKLKHAAYQSLFCLKIRFFNPKILQIFLKFWGLFPFLKKSEEEYVDVPRHSLAYTKFPISTVKFSHCDHRAMLFLKTSYCNLLSNKVCNIVVLASISGGPRGRRPHGSDTYGGEICLAPTVFWQVMPTWYSKIKVHQEIQNSGLRLNQNAAKTLFWWSNKL